MKKKDFCKRFGLTEDQFYGRDEYSGSLDLRSLTSIPDGFNPTVGGSLDLRSLTSIPDGFNPTVGGWLDLRSLTSIPDGFNPTVGGSLYLSSLTSIPDGFNPTVGGSLDLRSLTSIPDGFNPTVGGWPYLRSGLVAEKKEPPAILSWENGKYISCDDIFCEVLSHKGPVYKCRKLFQKDIFYVVEIDGKVAHGDTIKSAKKDLLYKISNRDTSRYSGKTLDTKVSHAEAIEMYRVITGACAFGTKDYVENRLPKRKDGYTVREMIAMTKGEYGNAALANFFKA